MPPDLEEGIGAPGNGQDAAPASSNDTPTGDVSSAADDTGLTVRYHIRASMAWFLTYGLCECLGLKTLQQRRIISAIVAILVVAYLIWLHATSQVGCTPFAGFVPPFLMLIIIAVAEVASFKLSQRLR